MKLSYFRGSSGYTNFGDELNRWIWPRLLPTILDQDDRTVFLGIGSIIGAKSPEGIPYRQDQVKVVFGSGFVSGYHEMPDVHDGTWDIFFVRGPRTAEHLGLPPEKSIGDSAILLRAILDHDPKWPRQTVAFMPHWQSALRGNWAAACRKAGIRMLDPRDQVPRLLDELLDCRLLISEAMHGAIVADSLRIPWIPVVPLVSSNRRKWLDWAESLSLSIPSNKLAPSSLLELQEANRHHRLLTFLLRILGRVPFVNMILNEAMVQLAARNLRRLATRPSQLSSEDAIEEATRLMLAKLEELKLKYGSGR